MDLDVLSTPGRLISLAARGFARLSEARLKPLGFGVGHLPVLVALHNGQASTQRDLARFAKIEQPPMAQMLARMERDGLIRRAPDPADGRMSRLTLTEVARARLPDAVAVLLQGNREALRGFTDEEAGLLVALLTRLIANLDRIASVEPSRATPIAENATDPTHAVRPSPNPKSRRAARTPQAQARRMRANTTPTMTTTTASQMRR